ncbi:hypothetical protein MPL3356_340181 [Mesorhizobium plurifarium]|uniref:Uncharacterized protein n=1 Tax=Mesorhizobium plurifarium TaxID=69974 RepID=A0A090DVS9_MESPL|nr:hypothetical protein MPL3356_340181 [Mesorhizobium plurifarium]
MRAAATAAFQSKLEAPYVGGTTDQNDRRSLVKKGMHMSVAPAWDTCVARRTMPLMQQPSARR